MEAYNIDATEKSDFPYFRIGWGIWLVISAFISVKLFLASFVILVILVAVGFFEDN